MTQFIAKMVRDNAETGYKTTPLYDELDLLSQSTLRTLQQMGIHFPPEYPQELDLAFDVSMGDKQYDETFNGIDEVIYENPYLSNF